MLSENVIRVTYFIAEMLTKNAIPFMVYISAFITGLVLIPTVIKGRGTARKIITPLALLISYALLLYFVRPTFV